MTDGIPAQKKCRSGHRDVLAHDVTGDVLSAAAGESDLVPAISGIGYHDNVIAVVQAGQDLIAGARAGTYAQATVGPCDGGVACGGRATRAGRAEPLDPPRQYTLAVAV